MVLRPYFVIIAWMLTFNVIAQTNTELEAMPVTLKPLSEVLVAVERDATASLVSLNDASLSAQLSAVVLAVNAHVGDKVQKDAVLASLDCRDFQTSLRQAIASVETVQARIKASAARAESSRTRIDSAQARIQSAEARVGSAYARVLSAHARAVSASDRAASAQARISGVQAQLELAQSQLQRNRQLRQQQLIPVDVLDQAQASYDAAVSNLASIQADQRAAEGEMRAAEADQRAAEAEQQVAQAEQGSIETELAAAHADFQAAEADYLTTVTELESAKAQQEAAQLTVERCLIRAPFAGQITERFLQQGQLASPGSPAFQILQIGALELSANLSVDDVRDLGQAKAVHFIADGKRIPVSPRAVLAQVTGDTRTQEVRFSLNESDHALPVGQNGRVVWQGQLPAVPASWVLRREGQLGVMLAEQNRAKFHPLPNAREGQPALIDLSPAIQLIDVNRIRVRDGQAITF